MSEQQQEQEIEKILKEIYDAYHRFESHKFYYKLKGKNLERKTMFYPKDFIQMYDIVFNPYFEYGLYIGAVYAINPSQSCIESKKLEDAITQFLYSFHSLLVPEFYIYMKDPLDQILAYRQLLTGLWPQHVYFCSSVYVISPYNPDPTSIFHGEQGVVTYCATLSNTVLINQHYEAAFIIDQYYNIRRRALEKLGNNEELKKLFQQNPVKACEINLIKSIIHDEIEEADKIMKQYNIIRIAFPID